MNLNPNSFLAFFDHALSVRITWLLVHFLWQGLAVGVTVFVINWIARGFSARLRYGVAVAGLLAMMVCVVGTWLITQPESASVETNFVRGELPVDSRAATGLAASTVELNVRQLQQVSQHGSAVESWAPVAVSVYTIGVALMLLRLGCSVVGVNRIRNASRATADELSVRLRVLSRQIGLRVQPQLRSCERVLVPFVVGVIRPTIMLPTLALTGMTQRELDAILIHELAHLRRADMVVNYLQRLVEAVLFFHPAVWYVSRVITVEREVCCDDIVLGNCSRNDYASALIRLAEACTIHAGDPALTTALAATGAHPSQLKRRVMRILGERPGPRSNRSGIGILVACILAVAITAFHLQAQTKDDEDASDASREQQGVAATVEHMTARSIVAPPLVYLHEDGVVISAPKDETRRLTAILNNLVNKPGVRVTAANIRLEGGRRVMTVQGENLDAGAVRSAIRKQIEPLARIIVEELNSKLAVSDQQSVTSRSFIGPVNLEAVGDSIIMRGKKQDVDRLKKIMAQIEQLASSADEAKQTPSQVTAAVENDRNNQPTVREDPTKQPSKIPDLLTIQHAVARLEQLLALQAEDIELAARFGAGHPKRTVLRQKIGLLERQLGLRPDSTQGIGPIRINIDGETFVVRGKKEDVDRAMKLIEGIDAQIKKKGEAASKQATSAGNAPKDENSYRIYALRNVVAGQVKDVLDEVFRDLLNTQAKPSVVADPKRNRIFVSAPHQLQENIEAMVNRLDQAPQDDGKTRFVAYQLNYTSAESMLEVLNAIFDNAKPLIAPDLATNRLLVSATDEQHEKIAELITQVDRGRTLNPEFVKSASSKLAKIVSGRNLGTEDGLDYEALFAQGRRLYSQNCVHCHGPAGRGDGPTAQFLDPHPRNFVSGKFKHARRGTAHVLADIERIVKEGIAGTAMPSFSRLGDGQRHSLAAFVEYLATALPDGPQGHLLFPLDVERAMMLDASDVNQSFGRPIR